MAPSEDVLRATREFLEEFPDAESALASLVDRDEDSSWTFEDVELDSGRFGELVSREIAVKTDGGGYQLRDRTAVAAVLDGDTAGVATADTDRSSFDLRSRVTSLDRREIGGLVAALVLVVVARLLSYQSVFRDGHLVSPANDPYFYRYWQAQLLERSEGMTDLGLVADMGGASRRPLTHAVNWWLAELLGGTPAAADLVAAWLPIVGAVGTAIVLYLLTKLLTGDVRASIAAVAFLALAPVHIVYTQVGFLEHRLHQYLWLGILALALTWLAVDVQRRYDEHEDGSTAANQHLQSRTAWGVAGVLAVAVTASAHIWAGSPLTFVPVALYVAVRVVADVRADIPPHRSGAPMLAGLFVGGLVAMGLYSRLGWSESVIGVTPLLVAAGAVVVSSLGEVWRRQELPAKQLLGVEVGVAVVGVLLFRVARPADVERLQDRADDLFFRDSAATEASTLFAPDLAVLLGPIAQVGVSFYLGLAVLLVATWIIYQQYEPGWLVVTCFGWYYLVLAAFQARFAAQLTFFIALFAGVACIYALSKIELVRPIALFERAKTARRGPAFEIPRGQLALYLGGALCLLLIFNFIYAPTLVGQTTHSDEKFEAAITIADHAESTERDYPDSAVEAQWGDIRMYNYFVSGESQRYNSNYESVLSAGNPDDERNGLRESGEYIVITEQEELEAPGYLRLFEGLGVGAGETESTGHFQSVYVGDEVRAFTVVEGATIEVRGSEGTAVTATTTLSIDDQERSYERSGEIENESLSLTVAHPGEYTVEGETVGISDEQVNNGGEVSVELAS